MNSSIPELQRHREVVAGILRASLDANIPDLIVANANALLEIDEQLNPSKDEPMTWKRPRTLPYITYQQRRYLHMGGDPVHVYHGEDLKLYEEIQEREAKD